MNNSRLALFFVTVWPEPRSSAAGVRTRELIGYLQRAGWDVATVSPAKKNSYQEELEKIGVLCLSCDPNSSLETDTALRSLTPTLVVYDRFVMEEQFGWRARELWPTALHWVDTQDLHSLRRAREQLARSGASWEAVLHPHPDALGENFLRELSSLYRADGALVVSEWEQEFLIAQGFPAARLLWLPLAGERESESPGFSERRAFAFLGNFRHPPNLDSVRWLLQELWPALRAQVPEAELHLYGAYPPAEISRHQGDNGVTAHGPVEDHRAALQKARVLLAPLRFGAGIKGKVIESWASGTVVLGSPLTFEGMGGSGPVFRDAKEFATLARSLHEDELAWSQWQKKGFAALERFFATALLEARFHEFLATSLASLREIRAQNVVGQMLSFHGARSTKYFSRWIEAKNARLDPHLFFPNRNSLIERK